jgi:hypothetical protein
MLKRGLAYNSGSSERISGIIMPSNDFKDHINQSVSFLAGRILSMQDRDPYSPTRGCFDRRYWAWKLVDFPEATFQRNVAALANLWSFPDSSYFRDDEILSSVIAGMDYAAVIQHKDGSFDQAFPHERSFGATGFILESLTEAFNIVGGEIGGRSAQKLKVSLKKAGDFLCGHEEKHGTITNHLAGACIGLLECGRTLDEPAFTSKAESMLDKILGLQSVEGWFPEYDGADPGYQTLCMYYLARIYELSPSAKLKEALKRSLEFLSYFFHPDGSYAGEYGSRRTAIFYPGGIAILAQHFEIAAAMLRQFMESIRSHTTVTLSDMDDGNIAPLLSNYTTTLKVLEHFNLDTECVLPKDMPDVCRHFPDAGLFLFGNDKYYAVLGASNGGVLKVFDKTSCTRIFDDGGYMGMLSNGSQVTTQITNLRTYCEVQDNGVNIETRFYRMPSVEPTPWKFVLLRILNLTLMRSVRIGNFIKKRLVRLLISDRKGVSVRLRRTVLFGKDRVILKDELSKSRRLKFWFLKCGVPFVAIHTASARYYEKITNSGILDPVSVDLDQLNSENSVCVNTVIEADET